MCSSTLALQTCSSVETNKKNRKKKKIKIIGSVRAATTALGLRGGGGATRRWSCGRRRVRVRRPFDNGNNYIHIILVPLAPSLSVAHRLTLDTTTLRVAPATRVGGGGEMFVCGAHRLSDKFYEWNAFQVRTRVRTHARTYALARASIRAHIHVYTYVYNYCNQQPYDCRTRAHMVRYKAAAAFTKSSYSRRAHYHSPGTRPILRQHSGPVVHRS
jgi:hypothetical protein